jgi:hypothetical protein
MRSRSKVRSVFSSTLVNADSWIAAFVVFVAAATPNSTPWTSPSDSSA